MSVDTRADSACKRRLSMFASIAQRAEEHPAFPSGDRWCRLDCPACDAVNSRDVRRLLLSPHGYGYRRAFLAPKVQNNSTALPGATPSGTKALT